MAIDFTKYLGGTIGKASLPKVLPSATYPGIVKSLPEYGSTQLNQNNPEHVAQGHGTPYVRFTYSITGWPDEVPEDQRYYKDLDGNEFPLDLASFAGRFYSDFWLTDDAKLRLHDFLESCGVEKGLSEQEAIPLVQGASVLITVAQYLSTANPNRPMMLNQRRIDKVTGTARL